MKLTASSKPDCLGKGDVICLQCEILYFICPLVLGVSRGDEADGQQQARLPGQGGCHMSSVCNTLLYLSACTGGVARR